MLEGLNPDQRRQVSRQIEAYENAAETHSVHVPFGKEDLELEIDPFIASPEIMNSGVQVVEYMTERPELFENSVVTDMGTGSGILGVSAGLLKARRVFMADIDPAAVANAQKNVEKHKLANVCETFQSDLFSAYGERSKSDVQIFNHPYFSDNPVEGKEWTRMMLADPELLRRYLREAPKYSAPEAVYLLSWLVLAGNEDSPDNDPEKVAPAFGYEITKITEQEPVDQGVQNAKFKIYELKYVG